MIAELFGGPMDGTEMEIEDGATEQEFEARPIRAEDYPHDFAALVDPPEIPDYKLVYKRTRAKRRGTVRIFRYAGTRG